jgi:hypothetical protein
LNHKVESGFRLRKEAVPRAVTKGTKFVYDAFLICHVHEVVGGDGKARQKARALSSAEPRPRERVVD